MSTPDKLAKFSYHHQSLHRHHNQHLFRSHSQKKTLKIPRVKMNKNLRTISVADVNDELKNEKNINCDKPNFDNFQNYLQVHDGACSIANKTNLQPITRTPNNKNLLTAKNLATMNCNSVNIIHTPKGPTMLPIESIINLPNYDNINGGGGSSRALANGNKNKTYYLQPTIVNDRAAAAGAAAGNDSISIASSTHFTMVNGFGPMKKHLTSNSNCCCCCKCKPIAAIIITMTILLIIIILVAIFSIELPRMMSSPK